MFTTHITNFKKYIKSYIKNAIYLYKIKENYIHIYTNYSEHRDVGQREHNTEV